MHVAVAFGTDYAIQLAELAAKDVSEKEPERVKCLVLG